MAARADIHVLKSVCGCSWLLLQTGSVVTVAGDDIHRIVQDSDSMRKYCSILTILGIQL